jgi:uncharacterized protein YgiM (DUF1202 family)
MDAASFYKGPSRLSGTAGDARKGEDVTVTALEGRFSKVKRANGEVAYIMSNSLVAKEKFDPGPASASEMKGVDAQAYEGRRFDPATEAEYRKEKGKALDDAYLALDRLMERPTYKSQRQKLEEELRAFRQEGKLGEYAGR